MRFRPALVLSAVVTGVLVMTSACTGSGSGNGRSVGTSTASTAPPVAESSAATPAAPESIGALTPIRVFQAGSARDASSLNLGHVISVPATRQGDFGVGALAVMPDGSMMTVVGQSGSVRDGAIELPPQHLEMGAALLE